TEKLERSDGDGYGDACYKAFTHKVRIAQAQKRVAKGKLVRKPSPVRKVLRKREDRRPSNILPPVCIICRKEKWMKREGTGTRPLETLVQGGSEGHMFIEAAALLHREDIFRVLNYKGDLLADEANAGYSYPTVLVVSPDTDVFVLAIAMAHRKKKAVFCLRAHPGFASTIADFGTEWTPSEETLKNLEAFVCALYGSKSDTDVNSLRHHLFLSAQTHGDNTLPPNQDSFNLHAMCTAYQTGIHRRCLNQYICAPPQSHGWMLDDNGFLVFKWMSLPAVPPLVSEFVQDVRDVPAANVRSLAQACACVN
ncbi:hypothetical protein BaRGS_00023252, partial [Batillaria attramentaria]